MRKARVFPAVLSALQFVLDNGEPQPRRGASMECDEIQRESGQLVGFEVGPIHRHADRRPAADDLPHPFLDHVPDPDSLVAQQPIDLLDSVLRRQLFGVRNCTTVVRARTKMRS